MDKKNTLRLLRLIGAFAAVFLGMRYLFPVFLPFALGTLLALWAEPGVIFFRSRLHFPRALATAVSVSLLLVLLLSVLALVLALGYRELTGLARGLPGAVEELSGQFSRLRTWAVEWTSQAPPGLSELLTQSVSQVFADGSVVLERAGGWAVSLAGRLVGVIPGGVVLLGTAVISGYMISAQLPQLSKKISGLPVVRAKLIPGWQRMKSAMGGWVRAQAKLAGVTFSIVLLGCLLLRTGNALLWAAFTAVVDAVPMLGSGTVLLPWALYQYLGGESVRAVGLLGVYVTATLTRSALEPKLVGKHLGLNPLLTLVALYTGFRFWGVLGMIFAPILAVMARQLSSFGDGHWDTSVL